MHRRQRPRRWCPAPVLHLDPAPHLAPHPDAPHRLAPDMPPSGTGSDRVSTMTAAAAATGHRADSDTPLAVADHTETPDILHPAVSGRSNRETHPAPASAGAIGRTEGLDTPLVVVVDRRDLLGTRLVVFDRNRSSHGYRPVAAAGAGVRKDLVGSRVCMGPGCMDLGLGAWRSLLGLGPRERRRSRGRGRRGLAGMGFVLRRSMVVVVVGVVDRGRWWVGRGIGALGSRARVRCCCCYRRSRWRTFVDCVVVVDVDVDDGEVDEIISSYWSTALGPTSLIDSGSA